MSADLLVLGPVPVRRGHPTTVMGWLTAKKAVRSAVLWGYVFGLYVAVSALGYASTYKSPGARAKFASEFGSNSALDALIGRARQIQTVAGFTSWRCLGVLSVVGAVWGLLAGTRLIRGEEDAGRWEMLLAGQTTRRRGAAQALAGIGAGLVVLWTVTAVITVVTGRSSKVHVGVSSALFFSLALVAGAAIFLAAGALASQLAATRRQAAGYAAAALGVSYTLRMVADSGTGLDWLRWATPLGWVEELQPLTAPRPFALVPIGSVVVMLVFLAVHLAGRRDLGASVLPDRSSSPPRTKLLSGPTGLIVRLLRGSVAAWGSAICAMSLLMGYISKQAGSTLQGNSSVERVLSRLGAPGLKADTYLGVAFLIVALMTALVAAAHLSAARGEEAEGRVDHLLVRPVSRWAWLGGRISATAVALVTIGVLSGVFAWLGAESQHAGVGLSTLLQAGLNTIAPALCVLGIGALVMGTRPRATLSAAYGLIAWSFLVEIIGGAVNLNHWILDASIFHQMAAAPAVSPNWTTAGAMVSIGVVCAAAGLVAFRHRDLVSA